MNLSLYVYYATHQRYAVYYTIDGHIGNQSDGLSSDR